jgi:alkylated DNA nucleotide flippase Atl1
MIEADPDTESRTYRRSLTTRLLGAAGAALFVGGAISYMTVSRFGPWLIVIGSLAILSLANLVTAYADRFTLGPEGIEYRNVLLQRLGVRPRRIRWRDVAQVRAQERPPRGRSGSGPRAVFLIPRSGRRMVLDSLEDFDEALRTIRRCCADTPRTGAATD